MINNMLITVYMHVLSNWMFSRENPMCWYVAMYVVD